MHEKVLSPLNQETLLIGQFCSGVSARRVPGVFWGEMARYQYLTCRYIVLCGHADGGHVQSQLLGVLLRYAYIYIVD